MKLERETERVRMKEGQDKEIGSQLEKARERERESYWGGSEFFFSFLILCKRYFSEPPRKKFQFSYTLYYKAYFSEPPIGVIGVALKKNSILYRESNRKKQRGREGY